MVTFDQLRDLRPAELEDAADGWHRLSSAAGTAKGRVTDEIATRLQLAVTGEGVDAAVERLHDLARSCHHAQVETGLIRTALNGLAGELRSAQKKLADAVADAEAEQFTVKSDGSVHWVDKDPAAPLAPHQSVRGSRPSMVIGSDPDPKRAKAQEYADRIGAALSEATEADARYAQALGRLHADSDLNVSDAEWVDAQRDMAAVRGAADHVPAGDIPKGKSPKENADWWKGLSQDEQADYIALHPASVGALDGLPATVRDEANRAVLAEKRADYQTQLNAIPPEPIKIQPGRVGSPIATRTAEWIAWDKKWGDKRSQLEASLKGMGDIQNRFARKDLEPGEKRFPRAYLLAFSPEGRGRAVIANGNPDTADHTAVYVPGTDAGLGNFAHDIKRMTNLWLAANSEADGKSVSTITWLGYDAPQGIKQPASSEYANNGAPHLNTFVDGIRASHATDSPGHLTVTGHSYGTTLVGSAARQGDLHADDIVTLGSPGVQVGRATDLDVPKGHVWNEEADGDKIPGLGRYVHGHREQILDTAVYIIPSDRVFGAHQMRTDTDGHSGYWDTDSGSLKNQALVVVGKYGDVEKGSG
ncbi:alpha/beta hydrolase [Streptomyces buecherae]|uniref:alpha/beta hydrolase n=1 Tax=Streptomyces buecherae TaxID=2763006 RepID=UPI0027E35965|nr:alpha/beta hydrolase [Streptomyces buecherae]